MRRTDVEGAAEAALSVSAVECAATAIAAAVAPDSATSDVGEGWINGVDGGLFHRWHRPTAGVPLARLLVFHGYGDHSGRFAHFKRWLAGRGVASDGFDFRGHGRSGGRRGFVRRWDEYLDDVRTVLAFCRPRWAAEGSAATPLFVLGHSHGGLILAAAGIRGVLPASEVAGCVMSAPWLAPARPLTWPWRVFARLSNVLAPAIRVATGLSPDLMTSDPAMVADSRADPLLLRAATPRWYATARRTQAAVLAGAGAFRLPLLCLIGDHDKVASPEAARLFVDRAGSADKAFELLPGARHELLRESNREKTFERVLGWMTERAASA